MSAETLKKAAALMRERAEAATPGDPDRGGGYEAYALGSEGHAVMGAPRPGYRLTRTFVARCGMNDWDTDKQNAEYIASWHPAVALAVADWLDGEAGDLEEALDALAFLGSGTRNPDGRFGRALAVAHAYLEEAP